MAHIRPASTRWGRSPEVTLTQASCLTASCVLLTALSQPSILRARAPVPAKARLVFFPSTPSARSPDFTLIRAICFTASYGPRKPTAAYSTALGRSSSRVTARLIRRRLPLLEIALVLVRLDDTALVVVNTNH